MRRAQLAGTREQPPAVLEGTAGSTLMAAETQPTTEALYLKYDILHIALGVKPVRAVAWGRRPGPRADGPIRGPAPSSAFLAFSRILIPLMKPSVADARSVGSARGVRPTGDHHMRGSLGWKWQLVRISPCELHQSQSSMGG